ncbi:MAG: SRPBCC domain-containing protein [Bacteroidota bacterium]|nr:SRPBCC domain-containing protein [Bacteroidota bacterium]MXW13799.1 SRPBCC domain-containing protein [Rhodothermaceae bacterium]MDE2646056.1 SRPBCC domain-containing protein [Bacteroidota bacterium]MXW33305.1 SRPBCC domain-containing protein [Rhodothermaceae bacterium]MYC03377.1 SRPBCC domain-containing protein [Rhodothermaceae bacterium]
MRTLSFSENFACTPQELFDALHTPSALRSWWNANRVIIIPRTNGMYSAAWGEDEDDPEYVSSGIYRVYDPPYKSVIEDFRYYAKSDPADFEGLMSITYEITARNSEAHLQLTHTGIPEGDEADAYFEACTIGWVETLKNLKKYVEKHM